MIAVILKILHPFKYQTALRVMSSEQMKKSFTNSLPCLLAKIAKAASLVAGPPKCYYKLPGAVYIVGTFRLDYQYETEYEYDFRISNQ